MHFKAALRRFSKFEITVSESIFYPSLICSGQNGATSTDTAPPPAGLVQDYITAGCLPGTIAKAKCRKEIYSVALKVQCGTAGSSVVEKGFLDT